METAPYELFETGTIGLIKKKKFNMIFYQDHIELLFMPYSIPTRLLLVVCL